MIKMKFLVICSFSVFIIMSFFSQGCDGIFPAQSKPNVPSDHNSNFGGFLHKGESEGGTGEGECGECHGDDLRGKLYNYNGTLIVTSSCYQCHGKVWDRNINGSGN
jgi:hypothetical protein